GGSRGRAERGEGAPHWTQAQGQALPLAHGLYRWAQGYFCRADAWQASRAGGRMGGAGNASKESARARDGEEAQSVSRRRASAQRPAADCAHVADVTFSEVGGGAIDGGGARQILWHRAAQDVRGPCVDQAWGRTHDRQPPAVRGLLSARDAADD